MALTRLKQYSIASTATTALSYVRRVVAGRWGRIWVKEASTVVRWSSGPHDCIQELAMAAVAR